jgi:hypothetical protein
LALKYSRIFNCILSKIFMLVFICIIPVRAFADGSPTGLSQGDFMHLARGGFGDSANSYAWSVVGFKDDLYVGVNRHHGWDVMGAMEEAMNSLDFLPSPSSLFDGPKSTVWGDRVWAEEFRGSIWRYRNGKWSMVHQANVLQGPLPIASNPLLPPSPTIYGYYPESYGYRNLAVYNNQIYAIGIGTWVPNMPIARVLRSTSGDPGSWTDISGIIATATNPRGLVEYKGNLYISASLPGTAPAGAGTGLVYRFDPSIPGYWNQVSEPGFGNADNAEIPELAVFNGCLYASTLNYTTGFEVWKTDGRTLPSGKLYWKRVVRDGFGDTWNQWGMTMQAFNGYLYIGTAVGGMVLKNNQPVGMRAFDVIRLDANDKAQLLVGAYRASDPPAGWPKIRTPLSKLPSGFANPLNVYVWSMGVYDGWLYLGTFDLSSNIFPYISLLLNQLENNSLNPGNNTTPVISEIKAMMAQSNAGSLTPAQDILLQQIQAILGNGVLKTASAFVSVMTRTFGGADVWKTKDGINWLPVTLNGFDNHMNSGIRRLVPVQQDEKNALIVGTANGYTGRPGGGCEVLYAK